MRPMLLDAILIAFHLIASCTLILSSSCTPGRGGGLSDMFGGVGGGTSMAGSTVVEKNLDRLTVIVALVFIFTTIGLSMRLS